MKVHLFECTKCTHGDFTAQEWDDEMATHHSYFVPITIAYQAACDSRAMRDEEYICPGCGEASRIWDILHFEVEPVPKPNPQQELIDGYKHMYSLLKQIYESNGAVTEAMLLDIEYLSMPAWMRGEEDE